MRSPLISLYLSLVQIWNSAFNNSNNPGSLVEYFEARNIYMPRASAQPLVCHFTFGQQRTHSVITYLLAFACLPVLGSLKKTDFAKRSTGFVPILRLDSAGSWIWAWTSYIFYDCVYVRRYHFECINRQKIHLRLTINYNPSCRIQFTRVCWFVRFYRAVMYCLTQWFCFHSLFAYYYYLLL